MLFPKPIYDEIINELIEHKDYSIQQLHKVVSSREKTSLPYFYTIINDLIEKRILFKEKGKLRLHSTRVIAFLEMAEKVNKSYIRENDFVINLNDGEQKSFYAQSLYDLDHIWVNILSNIILQSPQSDSIYVYNSHPYSMIGMENYDTQLIGHLRNQIKHMYFLIGNDTLLDNYGADLLRMQQGQVAINTETSFMKEGYMVNIVGDYIIEMVLPLNINSYFNVFFHSTKNLKEFNSSLFQEIFKMKAECKCTVIHSPQQAMAMKKEIMKSFK